VRGRALELVEWSDDGDDLRNYLETVLAESDTEYQTCPAAKPIFEHEPTNHAERKQHAAFDRVFQALILCDPQTVDELGDLLGLPKKLVRDAVERLQAAHFAVVAKRSKLIFRTRIV
jgi:hypothetical protein